MKRRLAIVTMALCLAVATAGCQSTKGDKDTKEKTEQSKDSIKSVDVDDLSKYVTLGEYKGLEGTKSIYEVTDEVLQMQIDGDLSSNPVEVTDRPVQNGDIVRLDYVGSVDGVEFEGGKGTNDELTIGSKSFIDGFEEGLIGATKGQNLDVNVTFPDPYDNNPDLAGKGAVFNVTVNSINVPAELNDEWAAANTEYKTAEEYKKGKKEFLEKNSSDQADYQLKTELFTKVQENAKVEDYPKDLLESEVKSYKEQIENIYAKPTGMTIDDFIKAQGMTVEDFEDMCTEKSKERLGQKLIVQAIIDKEDLQISQEEYDKMVDEYVTTYGFPSKEVMIETYGEEMIKDNILWDKVCEVIVKNAKVTEKTVSDNASGVQPPTDDQSGTDQSSADQPATGSENAGADQAAE